ncbi:MAG TPA: hypothetical protein VH933_16240, partial [Aestuariivirgaceae bacterium]
LRESLQAHHRTPARMARGVLDGFTPHLVMPGSPRKAARQRRHRPHQEERDGRIKSGHDG